MWSSGKDLAYDSGNEIPYFPLIIMVPNKHFIYIIKNTAQRYIATVPIEVLTVHFHLF